jgi:hypothetical protein
MTILMTERFRAWVCSCSYVGILGSNSAKEMDVCCECCMLSDKAPYYRIITPPEEFYRMSTEGDLESSTKDIQPQKKTRINNQVLFLCDLRTLFSLAILFFWLLSYII